MDLPYTELGAIIFFVALSVLFSGSETALTALGPQARKILDDLREKGRTHRFLDLWVRDRNSALICILFGNNLVNIAASAVATVAFEKMFAQTGYASFAIPAAVFVTTFLILTFGEIVPKTYAQNNARRFLGVTTALWPVYWGLRVTGTIWFFAKLSAHLITRAGGSLQPVATPVTEEDIEQHIEKAVAQGNLDQDQQKLLSSVFQFDDTIVHDIMQPRTEVVGIPRTAGLQPILLAIEESGYSRFPVYGDDLDDILGILYVRDLLTWFGKPQGGALELGTFLRPPYIVPHTKNISDLLSELQQNRVHMAIVVDEFGGTAGLVTVEDILEELVGEIYDEYDATRDGEDLARPLSDTSWEVEGRISMRDLEEATGLEFAEDESFSTVAGLVLNEVGSIPETGARVVVEGVTFTVLEADAKRVIRVQIDARETESMAHTGY